MRELEYRFNKAFNWFKSNGFLKTNEKKKNEKPKEKPKAVKAMNDSLLMGLKCSNKENQLFYDDSVSISESFSIDTKNSNHVEDFLSLENHHKKEVLTSSNSHNLTKNKSLSSSCLAKKPCSTKRTSSKKRKSLSNKEPIEFVKPNKKSLNVQTIKANLTEKPKAPKDVFKQTLNSNVGSNKTNNMIQQTTKVSENKKEGHLRIRLVGDEELIPLTALPHDFWQNLSSTPIKELLCKDFFCE